jgi:hypothetical protein
VSFLDKPGVTKGQFDVGRAETSMMQEPKIIEKNRLQCPICNQVFDSRQDYDSHWVSCHQDTDSSLASGSMGSMTPSEGQCVEKTA